MKGGNTHSRYVPRQIASLNCYHSAQRLSQTLESGERKEEASTLFMRWGDKKPEGLNSRQIFIFIT